MRRLVPIAKDRLVALATLAAVALILILRKPDSLQNPQFFAEDGTIFFIGARQLGAAAFLTPYGGYLLIVPRTIAWGASFSDPLRVPAIYNVAGLCLDVLVMALLFSRRVRLPAKPALALAYALVPHTDEVFLSLTNAQWCLALALILLLVADDATAAPQHGFDLGAVALCGFTGPFICFLAPLFIIRAALRRSWPSTALAAMAVLAAGVQACQLYAYRGHFIRAQPLDPYRLLSSMAGRLYGTFWMGYGIPEILPGYLWIGGGVAVTVLAGWVAFRPGEWARPRRLMALAWLCLAIPVAIKFRYDAHAIAYPNNGDRYFFLPHLLLGWLLLLACAESKGWLRLIPGSLLAAALLANVPYLRAPPLHDYEWAKHVQPVRDGDAFEIPINPSGLMLEGRYMADP